MSPRLANAKEGANLGGREVGLDLAVEANA